MIKRKEIHLQQGLGWGFEAKTPKKLSESALRNNTAIPKGTGVSIDFMETSNERPRSHKPSEPPDGVTKDRGVLTVQDKTNDPRGVRRICPHNVQWMRPHNNVRRTMLEELCCPDKVWDEKVSSQCAMFVSPQFMIYVWCTYMYIMSSQCKVYCMCGHSVR